MSSSYRSRHLLARRTTFERDRAAGYGVFLPDALARKYPNACFEWGWQHLFAAAQLSTDPRSAEKRRHHVDESSMQKVVRAAVLRARIAKRASCHTLRHYPESQTMPSKATRRLERAPKRRLFTRHSFSVLEALEEGQQLVVGAVAAELGLGESGLGERLFFDGKVCVEIDLCRLDRFMPEP